MEEWFRKPKDFKKVLNLVPSSSAAKKMDQFLWPSSVDYHSQLNPVFLHQVQDLELFSLCPIWLIRDGLIPLTWFFINHPKPPRNWKTRFLVSTRFSAYVPPRWREHFGTYEIDGEAVELRQPRKLLFLGMVADVFCSLKVLEQKMSDLKSRLSAARIEDIEKRALLVWKHNPFFRDERQNYHINYIRKVFEHFGTDITYLSWNQFMRCNSFKNFEIIELNDHLICEDSYLVNHALSGQGRLTCPSSSRSIGNVPAKSNYFPLSPFHGFRVNYTIQESAWASETWASLEKFQVCERSLIRPSASKKRNPFSWPKSLIHWARLESQSSLLEFRDQ